jgi:hypothetical protein
LITSSNLGRSLDRQIAWFGAFQDLVDEISYLIHLSAQARTVGNQAACLDVLPAGKDRRQPVFYCEFRDRLPFRHSQEASSANEPPAVDKYP